MAKNHPGSGGGSATKEAPRPARSRAASAGSGGGESRYKVLIVDDEKAVLQVLHDMLVDKGHEVVAVSSPEEALHKARKQKFDALILDLYMPEMSGMLFHAKLRVFEPELADRTVFISGYVSLDELRTHLASNACFLEKPFKSQDLHQMIHKVLPAKPRG